MYGYRARIGLIVPSSNTVCEQEVAVATPYTSEINLSEKESLERRGIDVTDIRGYHESLAPHQLKNDMIGRLTPEDAYAMAQKAKGRDNQAIFVSCTNFRAIEVIEKLERETRKPVVSSNQATLGFALRKLGIKDSIKGFGRLLEQH